MISRRVITDFKNSGIEENKTYKQLRLWGKAREVVARQKIVLNVKEAAVLIPIRAKYLQ